jgi:hypothetical protein
MEKLDFGTVAVAIVDFTFHAIIGNLTRKKPRWSFVSSLPTLPQIADRLIVARWRLVVAALAINLTILICWTIYLPLW